MEIPDCDLNFGATRISRGKAFFVGSSASPLRTAVGKRWVRLQQRTFLVEQVPVSAVANGFRDLPPGHASLQPTTNSERQLASATRVLPRLKAAVAPNRAMRVASLSGPAQGLVLDWNLVTSTNDMVFSAGTWYVSGPVGLGGTTVFEGNCVIKVAPTNNASLCIMEGGVVKCLTGPYRMAVITARGDSSVGEDIPGGPLERVPGPGITAQSWWPSFSYFRFAHIDNALVANFVDFTVYHSQFVDCGNAVSLGIGVSLYNVLFANCGTNLVYGGGPCYPTCPPQIYAEHVTADNCSTFLRIDGTWSSAAGLSLRNSILTAIGTVTSGWTTTVSTNSSVIFGSGAGVYEQQVCGGAYYLIVGSTNRNAGTTNIDSALLADLRKKTTYPPVVMAKLTLSNDTVFLPHVARDTNSCPARGWHYDPLDYEVGWVAVGPGRTLTIYPGTAIGLFGTNNGTYGLSVLQDSRLLSQGSPAAVNHLAAYTLVQEQPGANLIKPSYALITEVYSAAALNCRFTDLSVPAQDAPHFCLGNVVANLQDCELHGGQIVCWSTFNMTNCLLERVDAQLEQLDNFVPVIRNNLFLGGTFYFYPMVATNAIVRDNLFDHTTIPVDLTGWGYNGGYNAFVTACDRLRPEYASDIVLPCSPAYQSGPLGRFYLPPDSPLVDAGSVTNAALVGMYHFTTQTNQLKEANSRVDISYHLAAANAQGAPVDTDSDLLPDALEDANGNGITDPGETDFAKADTDADGLTDGEEMLIWIDADNPGLHLDPLSADTGNTGVPDGQKDGDHDGISNLAELRTYGSLPWNSHTFNTCANDAEYLFTCPVNGNCTKAHLTLAYPLTDPMDFTISGADANASYDLYFVPTVAWERWQYRRIFSGIQCDANGHAAFQVPLPDPNLQMSFFLALSAKDDDSDGLSNGYECYFPYNGQFTKLQDPDSDLDGMWDGWEVQYGLNPMDDAGVNGKDGNPDTDTDPQDGSALTNGKEWERYNGFDASYDPWKAYGTAQRPVVTIQPSYFEPYCEWATYTITRNAGSAGNPDYSQPLIVYYSVGGTLRYLTDYNLAPEPQVAPGDQDYPDGYPRTFPVKIPEGEQSVNVTATFIGHPVQPGQEKTLVLALTPYGVSRKSQVGVDDTVNWQYVVNLQGLGDRATRTFIYDNMLPTADDITAQTCRNQDKQITLSGGDYCASQLSFAVTQPGLGTGSVSQPVVIDLTTATVTYSPGNYCGPATFHYTVNNGVGDSELATVNVAVGDPNPEPGCRNLLVKKGEPLTFTLSGTINLCPESLNFNITQNTPTQGQLVNPTRVSPTQYQFTYVPNSATYVGPDDFSFTVSDCGFNSRESDVPINIVDGPSLIASCGPNQINLHWTIPKAVADLDLVSDFVIYRCEVSSGYCTPADLYDIVSNPQARSYVDTGNGTPLDPAKIYCYLVTFRQNDRTCDPPMTFESPFSNRACEQLCARPRLLITGMNAGPGGTIDTYDFATGELVASFTPTESGYYNGRGLAIKGSEIFYTKLAPGVPPGPSDGIHVAPYGIDGSGGDGDDLRVLPNPWPGVGIQDLAFHNNILYVLAGYPDNDPDHHLRVYKVDPVAGTPIDPVHPYIAIAMTYAHTASDGFTVLPWGNFLINDDDGDQGAPSTVYREYNGASGALVSGGLVVNLGPTGSMGFSSATGVALAPDGQSLYFVTEITENADRPQTLVHVDMSGNLIDFQPIQATALEDIDVVVP